MKDYYTRSALYYRGETCSLYQKHHMVQPDFFVGPIVNTVE